MVEGWPIVFSGNQPLYFVNSKVVNQWMIKVPAN